MNPQNNKWFSQIKHILINNKDITATHNDSEISSS